MWYYVGMDHAFVFPICENRTESILFMGGLTNPTQRSKARSHDSC